ncbi:unnamed protein product [Thelazia callipaeda]|uniref:Transposase n=1 Tax=Thelazia callipaeda TaxID=103827 RepID=A0A0N5D2K3_THECL|nr:unnamed protein product [Thelazia callipaeda]
MSYLNVKFINVATIWKYYPKAWRDTVTFKTEMCLELRKEIVANENVEIAVDSRVKIAIRIKDRWDILVYDKKGREVTLIEAGITGQDRLTAIETEKKRKHISDRSQENARKHLIQSALWIRRGRSSRDQHSRTEHGINVEVSFRFLFIESAAGSYSGTLAVLVSPSDLLYSSFSLRPGGIHIDCRRKCFRASS